MRAARPSLGALSACASLVLVGCQPAFGPPGGDAGGGGEGGRTGLRWLLEPDVPPEAAPRALRVRLRADSPVDPRRVQLVTGHLGPGHLRQLAAGAPSNALEERFLPATIWRDGDDVVVAPHEALLPGEDYGIAAAELGQALDLVVAREVAGEIWLERTWPPRDAEAVVPAAIFCGGGELPSFSSVTELAPVALPATASRGAFSTGVGKRCVRVAGSQSPSSHTTHLLAPPVVQLPGVRLALEPAPLALGAEVPADLPPLACEPAEVVVGPGCARVFDDRAFVRAPAAALLWGASGDGLDEVAVTDPGEVFALHPLSAASDNWIAIGVADVGGRETTFEVLLRTTPPMAHVILNEVLADCVGPEPACEWIELLNDGAVTAGLGGLRILDVGGEVVLPDALLEPGAFALVVREDYAPDPAFDPLPATGALLLRVPTLGRGGLANDGELLRLVDAEGLVLSAIPPIAAEEAGRSTARRRPALADTPVSFVSATPTPGAPNGLP